jgi:hypothetical protein
MHNSTPHPYHLQTQGGSSPQGSLCGLLPPWTCRWYECKVQQRKLNQWLFC